MYLPLISICIPTYNGQAFLSTCLDSAISQSYKNIEIIIVDDCSTDKTYDIAKDYAAKDSRIKVFKNEKNLGLVGNWNRCIELSAGEWIKFLFQDDYFSSDCIEVMVNSISENDKIITSTRQLVLDKSLDEATKNYSVNQTITFERLGIVTNVPVFITPEKISSFAVQNICMNFIGEPTVIMFKKEVVKEFGNFNPDLIQICDLEYFLRIATKYGVKYIPKPITYFRVHKGSTGASNISGKLFSMKYIDPIIMVNQLLFANFFTHFREALSLFQKIKLKAFFKARVHESCRDSLFSIPENMKKLEDAVQKYPKIATYRKETIVTRTMLQMIKLKRKWKHIN